MHSVCVQPFTGTLKPQSNGPLYSNTVIGTLVVDGWAVTFGTARRGLGGAAAHPCCTKCNNPPINGQCTNFIVFNVSLQVPVNSKGLTGILFQSYTSSVFRGVSLTFSLRDSHRFYASNS